MAWSRIYLFSTLGFLLLALAGASQWNIISDNRVTSKHVTPVLGRGFSVATGEILSTCLIVGLLTDASSDFDFSFFEVNDDNDLDHSGLVQLAAVNVQPGEVFAIHGGFSWARNHEKKMHYVCTTMTIDTYYASINEAAAPLVRQASALLQRTNYVQFFQACGPNYIRSIRRLSTVNIYANGMSLRAANVGGASMGGQSSLVVKSIEEFDIINEIAFRSMQDPLAGVVKTVELVPWINNGAFQVNAKVNVPLTRNKYNCYLDAVTNQKLYADCVDMNDAGANDENLTCGWVTSGPLPVEKYNETLCDKTGEEDAVNMEVRKFNLIANSEYLATIDSMIRQETHALNVHMNCVTRLLDYHESYRDEKLYDHRHPTENPVNLPTVFEIRNRLTFGDSYLAVTPLTEFAFPLNFKTLLRGRGGLLHERKAKAINRKLKKFVSRCYTAIQREVHSVRQGMMQYKHWTGIPHCRNIKCSFLGYEWLEDPITGPPTADCTLVTDDFLVLDGLLQSYCPADLHKWVMKTETWDSLSINIPQADAERPVLDPPTPVKGVVPAPGRRRLGSEPTPAPSARAQLDN